MRRIDDLLDEACRDLPEIRRDLHAHPGLAFAETRAAAVVRRELERAGIPHAAGIGGTGIVGWIVPPGAEGREGIALRADLDALPIEERTNLPHASAVPGVMHACGHDGHASILIGAARVLVRRRDALPRPVKLLFQPAEETGEGARALLDAGALEGGLGGFEVGAVVGLHGWPSVPLGAVALRPGPFMASMENFRIRVAGRGGHASAPHDAADPVVAAAAVVTALQTIVARNASPLAASVVTVASFHAGEADNVIPSEAVLGGTIRSLDDATGDLLRRRVQEVAAGTAGALGCTATIELRRRTPVLVNDPALTERVAAAAAGALGPGRVVRLEAPVMGSEDFALYGRRAPSCFFFLGLSPEGGDGPRLHTAGFDFDDRAIRPGVAVLCRFATAS